MVKQTNDETDRLSASDTEAERLERLGKGKRPTVRGSRPERLTAPEYDRLPLDERGHYQKDNAGYFVLRPETDTIGKAEYDALSDDEREKWTLTNTNMPGIVNPDPIYKRVPELTPAERQSAEKARHEAHPGETDAERKTRERRESAEAKEGGPAHVRTTRPNQAEIDRAKAERDREAKRVP